MRISGLPRRRDRWILVLEGVTIQASSEDLDQCINHSNHLRIFKSACLSNNDRSIRSKQLYDAYKALPPKPAFGKVTSQKRNRESIRVGFARNLTKDEVCHSNVCNDQGRSSLGLGQV